ncbi:hypothetical protein [Iamia sp.]|nr:hypothetical protein [Iamia sp.]HXH57263.1 hypothetical protein [Iamia sp.]
MRSETRDLLRRAVAATAFLVGCVVVAYVAFFVLLPQGGDGPG